MKQTHEKKDGQNIANNPQKNKQIHQFLKFKQIQSIRKRKIKSKKK